MAMSYTPGGSYGICDRCGFQFRARELRKEWTGLMVCAKDFDTKPPNLLAKSAKAEGLPRPDARPDSDVETANTTTPGDL
jgi:hypothetical protein